MTHIFCRVFRTIVICFVVFFQEFFPADFFVHQFIDQIPVLIFWFVSHMPLIEATAGGVPLQYFMRGIGITNYSIFILGCIPYFFHQSLVVFWPRPHQPGPKPFPGNEVAIFDSLFKYFDRNFITDVSGRVLGSFRAVFQNHFIGCNLHHGSSCSGPIGFIGYGNFISHIY